MLPSSSALTHRNSATPEIERIDSDLDRLKSGKPVSREGWNRLGQGGDHPLMRAARAGVVPETFVGHFAAASRIDRSVRNRIEDQVFPFKAALATEDPHRRRTYRRPAEILGDMARHDGALSRTERVWVRAQAKAVKRDTLDQDGFAQGLTGITDRLNRDGNLTAARTFAGFALDGLRGAVAAGTQRPATRNQRSHVAEADLP